MSPAALPRPLEVDAIAFDLDGTLVDSAPDIQQALNSALASEHLAPYDLQQVVSWIGDGPDALIDQALTQAGIVNSSMALPRRLRAAYDRAALQQPFTHGTVFHGIPQALRQLQADWPLVVVTNKPTALAHAVLQAAGLQGFFRSVHGADSREQRKPAPYLLQAAGQVLGVVPARLLMVGDSAADLGAAAAADCPVAFARWGYGKPGAITAHPRAPPLDCPSALPALLASRPRRTGSVT